MINSLLKLMSQIIILKTTHILKIMAFKVQVCFLISLLSSFSHKMKFYDLETYFFYHEVGGSIKKQESALFSNVAVFATRRGMNIVEQGCLLPVWCEGELHFHGSIGRGEIRNRWVLEARILCFRVKHLDMEYN